MRKTGLDPGSFVILLNAGADPVMGSSETEYCRQTASIGTSMETKWNFWMSLMRLISKRKFWIAKDTRIFFQYNGMVFELAGEKIGICVNPPYNI